MGWGIPWRWGAPRELWQCLRRETTATRLGGVVAEGMEEAMEERLGQAFAKVFTNHHAELI